MEYQVVKRRRVRRNVWQVLIQWQGVPLDEVSRADYDNIALRIPILILEDNDVLEWI